MEAEPKNTSETKYPQAPLSEVIFGITLNEGRFNDNNLLIDLVSAFKKEGFINIELHQPLSNEKLEGYHFSKSFNPDVAGQVLYRCFDETKNNLIQIQNNKFLFNWIRNEGEDPKSYPGYEEVKKQFFKWLNLVEELYEANNKSKIAIEENVKYCELTYQDRIFWEAYTESLSGINEIINHSLPSLFFIGENLTPNNEFANFTFDLSNQLNGHGLIALNTSTSNEGQKQVFNFQCPLRGGVERFDKIEDWYDTAHKIQIETFENFFKEKIKEEWQNK